MLIILIILFIIVIVLLKLKEQKISDKIIYKTSSYLTENSNKSNFYEDSLKDYITIPELILLCNLPGKCNEKLLCEDKEVKVRSYVDFINVFDKRHYPQLPYEKFRIHDSTKTNFLEVWTVGKDNSAIFKKIFNNNVKPPRMIFIRAKIEGIDIPLDKGCERWIKLIINSEKDIFFSNF